MASKDKDKEEYLDLLRNNEVYKSVLEKSSNEKERRFIKAYTEDFMLKFYEGFYKDIQTTLKNDPESLKKAITEIGDELIMSGSNAK